MPGFDKNRFVDLRREEEDEFSCGICHDIFARPVVVQCCRQIYCEDCITEWLNIHQNCPNDRSQLNKNQLTQPPIVVQNLLAKLKIRCDFESDGCQHIGSLESLTLHLTKYCNFNPDRKCRDCGGLKDENSQHSCIQNLFAIFKSSSDAVRDFQSELVAISASVESIRGSLEDYGQMQGVYDLEYANTCQEISSLKSEVDKLKLERDESKQNENMLLIKIESLSDEFSKLMAEVDVLKEEIKVFKGSRDNPNFR